MAGKKVDINAASVEELAQLTGIGKARAEAIVERRKHVGGFTTLEDILSIPGIEDTILEVNQSRLICGIWRKSCETASKNLASEIRKSNQNGRWTTGSSGGVGSSSKADQDQSQGLEPSGSREKGKKRNSNIGSRPGVCPLCGCNSNNSTMSRSSLLADCNIDVLENGSGNGDCSPVVCTRGSPATEGDLMDDGDGDDETDQGGWGDCAQDVLEEVDEAEEDGVLDVLIVDEFPTSRQRSGSGSIVDAEMTIRETALMKRKSDEIVDTAGLLGKKACLPEEIASEDKDETKSCVGIDEEKPECQTPKKRMSARPAPPAELGQWLNIFQRWNNVERLSALNHLIDGCEPNQVRHMMNIIEPQFQRDFISLLPKELALYVLSFLEPRDLLRAAQTCCYWRFLAEDNLLWREKCREADIDEVIGRRADWACTRGGGGGATPPNANPSDGCPQVRDLLGKRRSKVGLTPSPWKAAFMRQHNIEMNWRCRPIRSPKVLKGHDDHVITCLQFSGSRVVSGSDDNTLKVWSASTGKCLRTLVGHTGGVWSSQMSGSTIVSGSTDRTLKVWNAETGQCVHTLYGHTSTVRCMHLHGYKVVSGSRDATLRVWDIESGECLHVLVGHVAAVRCVQYDGRLVVSGAYDYMVKVWNPEREECLHTLQGHTNRVYSLQFDGVHVVSGSLDTSIRVWDVETGACKHTLMGHQSLTSGMELKNNILVSGNADSTVKVWDITTGQCLQTLSGPNKHLSAVTCLQFNCKFVITSSDDGTVKLWDLKTGDFIRNLVALESGGSGGVVWRIRASPTKLVCAVGSRNGTEETKLLVLDFNVDAK